MVLKSSLTNATKIKSEPKCDKEIPKKLAEIWQNFQEKKWEYCYKIFL
jgi:hypothetical protein